MSNKDKQIISLEISKELRELLRTEAFKRDVSLSEVIRQIILKELKNSNKD